MRTEGRTVVTKLTVAYRMRLNIQQVRASTDQHSTISCKHLNVMLKSEDKIWLLYCIKMHIYIYIFIIEDSKLRQYMQFLLHV